MTLSPLTAVNILNHHGRSTTASMVWPTRFRRMPFKHRGVLALSLAVAVLLVLDVVVVLHRRERGEPNALAQRIQAIDQMAPKPDPAVVASIDAATREIEAFVSTTRGLKFTRAVKVRVLNDAQFN